MREFELLGPNEDKPNPLLLERLRACCQVINALGYKVQQYTQTVKISRLLFLPARV